LHEGHLSLVKKSTGVCSKSLVSIYINPTQFAPDEDLASYPRCLDADLDQLKKNNIDAVFLPSDAEMYPENDVGFQYQNKLFNKLEGKSRPKFFYGVTRIVFKLFNIINPTHAFFGEKDAQQSRIVQKMISDLNLNIEFLSCPTIRDDNGLALSSRNNYLTLKEQEQASLLYKSLMLVKTEIINGENEVGLLKDIFKNALLQNSKFKLDYISVACNLSLEELTLTTSDMLISTAVFFKKVRLIDNFFYQSST